jgi:hypothetical protein
MSLKEKIELALAEYKIKHGYLPDFIFLHKDDIPKLADKDSGAYRGFTTLACFGDIQVYQFPDRLDRFTLIDDSALRGKFYLGSYRITL